MVPRPTALQFNTRAYTHTLCTPPDTENSIFDIRLLAPAWHSRYASACIRCADVQIGVIYTRSRFITQILYRGKERLGDDFCGRWKSFL
uniref:Uncharacterized protein n=1 Tax=Trichogramma kaykai TaxID=54128 RepID=A0ABD2XND2_9HYME